MERVDIPVHSPTKLQLVLAPEAVEWDRCLSNGNPLLVPAIITAAHLIWHS
jgi:hypothetical protein